MKKFPALFLVASAFIFGSCSNEAPPKAGVDGETESSSEPLKINGSTTVNLPIAEAAEVLRARTGKEIQVDTQGGSSGGISSLGEGLVQLGMASKPVGDSDREKFPDCDFNQVRIGEDAVALIVSKDVWESGVKSISKEEMKGIYGGEITNWKDLGGTDQRIAFFNKEPGRGTWEVFAKWAYGDYHDAPQASFPEVGGNEETRNKVSTTRGALSQLSSSWADGETVFALGIEKVDGTTIDPTGPNIATGNYPMSRPLFVLTNGEPKGGAKIMIDFILSDEGQELVRKHGYLALAELKE